MQRISLFTTRTRARLRATMYVFSDRCTRTRLRCTIIIVCRFGLALQDLTYAEFFAGEGLVWQAVHAEYPGSVKVDIKYMHAGSAMDMLSDSGLASCPQS